MVQTPGHHQEDTNQRAGDTDRQRVVVVVVVSGGGGKVIARMLTHESEEAAQLPRLAVDEGVREGARRGHKGCLCFQQRSDLRNVPLGHGRELPTANNALNVSHGRLEQTPLALLQGPGSSEMMERREPYTSGVPAPRSQKDGAGEGCTSTEGFSHCSPDEALRRPGLCFPTFPDHQEPRRPIKKNNKKKQKTVESSTGLLCQQLLLTRCS